MKVRRANILVDGKLQTDMRQTVGLLWEGEGEKVYMCLEILSNEQIVKMLQHQQEHKVETAEDFVDAIMGIDDGSGGLLYMEQAGNGWYTNDGMEVIIRDVL